ncbi:MAG: hypothetical protein LBC13_04295 [Clostridiales bacterium]|jgi:hypothetical protein|nr:hypothetical protein [Clostridiales bacterium]
MDFDFSENNAGMLFRPYDKRDKTAALELLSGFWHLSSLARKDDIRELLLNREFHRVLSSNNYCEVAESDGVFKGIIFADIDVIDAKNRPMDKIISRGYDAKLKALVGEDFRAYAQFLLLERTRAELLESLGGTRFDAEIGLILADPACPESALLLFERLREVLRENLAKNYFIFSNTYCDFRLYQLNRCVKWAETEISLDCNNGAEMHICRIYAADF